MSRGPRAVERKIANLFASSRDRAVDANEVAADVFRVV
jgi:hypothetical protein